MKMPPGWVDGMSLIPDRNNKMHLFPVFIQRDLNVLLYACVLVVWKIEQQESSYV